MTPQKRMKKPICRLPEVDMRGVLAFTNYTVGSYWVQRSLLRTRRGETGYKADCIVPRHKRGFEVDLTATYISCHRDKLLRGES